KWEAYSPTLHSKRMHTRKNARTLNIDRSFYGRIESGKKGCSVDPKTPGRCRPADLVRQLQCLCSLLRSVPLSHVEPSSAFSILPSFLAFRDSTFMITLQSRSLVILNCST